MSQEIDTSWLMDSHPCDPPRAAGSSAQACSAPPCEATKDGKHRMRAFIRRGHGDRVRMYPRCTKCGYEPNSLNHTTSLENAQ